MMAEKICFKILYAGKTYMVSTHFKEYISLMTLICDKIYPDDFGECGGVGRCGTCLVRLGSDIPQDVVGKEAKTLEKMAVTDPNHRLACQIQVDESLNDIVITILSDY